MNTFILYWNPQISNIPVERRDEFVQALRDGMYLEFNWAIWDWQKAKAGDRFFRIRCGMPNPADDGVIDSGFLISEPFLGEDWSGKGRKVHYVNMEFDAMLDYDYCPALSSDLLDLRIPHFDWHGGHSGRLLDDVSASDLEALWEQHLHKVRSNAETEPHVFSHPIIID